MPSFQSPWDSKHSRSGVRLNKSPRASEVNEWDTWVGTPRHLRPRCIISDDKRYAIITTDGVENNMGTGPKRKPIAQAQGVSASPGRKPKHPPYEGS